ncbi:MAG: universal stress protein [Desulfurococcaceae archaeon TW002]
MSYYPEPTYIVSYLFRRILIPVDGSAMSYKALEVGLDFASRYGSKIRVLIVEDSSIPDVNEVKKKVTDISSKRGISIEIKIKKPNYPDTSVATAIVEELFEEHYDLVILTARGRTLNPDLVIGSVALSVLINSNTSIFLIR